MNSGKPHCHVLRIRTLQLYISHITFLCVYTHVLRLKLGVYVYILGFNVGFVNISLVLAT